MILFNKYRQQRPEIQRAASYDHEEFRVSLMRQLGSMAVDEPTPLFRHPQPPKRRSAEAAIRSTSTRFPPA